MSSADPAPDPSGAETEHAQAAALAGRDCSPRASARRPGRRARRPGPPRSRRGASSAGGHSHGPGERAPLGAVHLPRPGRFGVPHRPRGGVAVHPAGPAARAARQPFADRHGAHRRDRARPTRSRCARSRRDAEPVGTVLAPGRPGQRAGAAAASAAAPRRHHPQGHVARPSRSRSRCAAPASSAYGHLVVDVERLGRGRGRARPPRLGHARRQRRARGRRRRLADVRVRAGLGRRRGARRRARAPSSAATPGFGTSVVTFGGDLVRLSPTVRFTGPGGDAELLGLSFADAGQHQEHRLLVDHAVPHCRSRRHLQGRAAGPGRAHASGSATC